MIQYWATPITQWSLTDLKAVRTDGREEPELSACFMAKSMKEHGRQCITSFMGTVKACLRTRIKIFYISI